MRAQDLMTSPAITCHVNDSLSVAAKRMWDADVGAVAVVNDEGKVTGMITDRDICMAAFTQGGTLDSLLVNGAMAKHVVSAGPDATISDIERLMADHQVRRIPIVNPAGEPLGVITMNDIALESVQPDTTVKHAVSKLAHTFAAICQPRTERREAM